MKDLGDSLKKEEARVRSLFDESQRLFSWWQSRLWYRQNRIFETQNEGSGFSRSSTRSRPIIEGIHASSTFDELF